MLAIAELHLHAMLATPAFRLYLLALGLLLCGKALEQRFQSCQQALFIAIPEGDLHLAASQGDMDIGAGRCLWQCGDWLTLGLSLRLTLGLLGEWLASPIAGPIQRVQPGLSQDIGTFVNAIGQPVLAEALGCLGEVFARALPIDHKVGCSAISLACNLGCAISLQLDVT